MSQTQQQQQKRITTKSSPYQRDMEVIPLMNSVRQIDFPLPRILRNAMSRVSIESPYLTIYRRDNRMPTGHIPIALVELHGSWKADRAAIATAAARILPYSQSQLLTYLISNSDYYQTLQSNDKALEKLRDTAAYEVAKSVLKPNNSTETYNAAAATNTGIKKSWLSHTIENVIDVSSNQADKAIERLIMSRKLLVVPRASFETDDILILNNWL